MSNFIGIDFGMQNLKVCYFDGRKNNKVDLEGKQTSSSKISKNAVFYKENEENILIKFFFGSDQAEIARKYADPDYVRYIKRELQKEKYYRSVCNGKYTFSALQIITDIFNQIKFKMIESRYDTSAPTVLTVPVIFSEAQKEMLKYCAVRAGFNVMEVITEPFAALFSDETYEECIEDIDKEDLILMFDFGASTLDICLIKVSNNNKDALSIETVSSTGVSYGGKDITDLISNFLIDKYSDITEIQIKANKLDENSKQATFFEYAEQLKNNLYEEEDIPEVSMNFYGSEMVLKRTNVDSLLNSEGIWNTIKNAIVDMFDSTDEYDEDDFDLVSKIVMTGGTSKIQYFRDKIAELFNKAEIIGDIEEDDATYCSVSSGAVNFAKQEKLNVINRSAMIFGIELNSGFEEILCRNSIYDIPGKRKYIDVDWLNLNDWKIKVFQTLKKVREHTSIDSKDTIYSGYIKLNKNLYPSEEDKIVVQFKYTKQGLAVTAAAAREIKNIIEDNILLESEVNYE